VICRIIQKFMKHTIILLKNLINWTHCLYSSCRSQWEHLLSLEIKKLIRHNFKNTLILCGGYDKEKPLTYRPCCFWTSFINNPDLVERFKNDWPLSEDLKTDLFYSADEKDILIIHSYTHNRM
jgi:hypothetical protein